MQRHVWIDGREAIHELGFMGGEVLHDKVDFPAGGLCGYLGESRRTPGPVAAGSASDDLAASRLEGGIKGESAQRRYSTRDAQTVRRPPSRPWTGRFRAAALSCFQRSSSRSESRRHHLFVHAEGGGIRSGARYSQMRAGISPGKGPSSGSDASVDPLLQSNRPPRATGDIRYNKRTDSM
jgi:hypothetical protein